MPPHHLWCMNFQDCSPQPVKVIKIFPYGLCSYPRAASTSSFPAPWSVLHIWKLLRGNLRSSHHTQKFMWLLTATDADYTYYSDHFTIQICTVCTNVYKYWIVIFSTWNLECCRPIIPQFLEFSNKILKNRNRKFLIKKTH